MEILAALAGALASTGLNFGLGKLFGGGGGGGPKMPKPKENFETNPINIPQPSTGKVPEAPQLGGDPNAWKMAIGQYLGR